MVAIIIRKTQADCDKEGKILRRGYTNKFNTRVHSSCTNHPKKGNARADRGTGSAPQRKVENGVTMVYDRKLGQYRPIKKMGRPRVSHGATSMLAKEKEKERKKQNKFDTKKLTAGKTLVDHVLSHRNKSKY